MKKTLYTLAFVALVSFGVNAQNPQGAKKAPAAKETTANPETINPDGTLKQIPVTPAATEVKTDDSKAQKKEGTRMAITEKGVPASKKPADKKTEATGTEKH